MEADCIDFKDTGYFSKIILDYLKGDENILPFYQYQPSIEAFSEVLENKSFSDKQRTILHDSLQQQYQKAGIKLDNFELLNSNLSALKNSDTFVVTTGHQLCLFTGPLYFIYKIVSAIKLAKQLREIYPTKKFVPVFWMATEDHDFDEINHFNFKGSKVQWNTDQKGAVGRMKTEGLEEVYKSFESILVGYSSNSEELKSLFRNAYLKHDNLADATRFLVNELFLDCGVVIIDGDDVELKRQFIPLVKEELLKEVSSELVSQQSEYLAKHYKTQVNAREINLFYLLDNSRNRIVKENKSYFIHDTELKFSEAEMLEELENHPERFSPNVLLRPIYQELILPNLAYIGGGGELAYWFQLKSTFEHFDIPMPMLLLRNSAAWLDEKQTKYFKLLGINYKQLFLNEGVLLKEWVKQQAEIDLELPNEKQNISKFYADLVLKASEVEPNLETHVNALEAKQIKELERLSEKFIRAKRRKSAEAEARIKHLKVSLFPGRGLQERHDNFSEIYLSQGKSMIEVLLEAFELPSSTFTILH